MLVQIPNSTLVRDTDSMALIVNDKNGLEAYYRKRNNIAAQKDEINKVKQELNDVRHDMLEIKTLLMKLLEKSN